MADTRRRRAALVLLAAGIAVLAAGVAVAFARHDGAGREVPLTAQEQEALRQARNRVPRFRIAYLWLPLSYYRRVTQPTAAEAPAAYEVARNDVSRRVATNRPPLDRNLGLLPANSYHDGLARALGEHRVRRVQRAVLALAVTPTAGQPVRLRLYVDRVELGGFADIYDATDITELNLASDVGDAEQGVTSRRRTAIEWTVRGDGVGTIVPFGLTQLFEVPDVPPNADALAELPTGGSPVRVELVDDVVFVPRRLTRLTPEGREVELDLTRALDSPMIVDPVASG